MLRVLRLNLLREFYLRSTGKTTTAKQCATISYRNCTTSSACFDNAPNPYKIRDGENTNDKRARLLYQSRKRGMLENGLLLGTFAGKFLEAFTEEQLKMYDQMINLPSNDWDLYYWATGVAETPLEFQTEIMDMFKKHVRNELKETRYRQPDIH